MMKKAILFDLDATLLPMDQDEFTNTYFKFLAAKICPLGYEVQQLIDAVWKATHAMVFNDGAATNETVFWKAFAEVLGEQVADEIPVYEEFYANEFNQASIVTKGNPYLKQALEAARKDGKMVILATNPIFPLIGVESRLGWIDSTAADYDYITTYESESFCKPNPKYYGKILERFDLKPEECLMVGNDVKEDMYASNAVGIDSYLVTDFMIPDPEKEWTGKQGTFTEMIEYLKTL